jgi:hypothetical protein
MPFSAAGLVFPDSEIFFEKVREPVSLDKLLPLKQFVRGQI